MLAALFVAVGLVLPLFTGQIKGIGRMLLPMHIPVMLCGLVCGPYYGLAVGFILPLLRSVLFGMPTIYPSAVGMAFELATYGIVTGFLCIKVKPFSLFAVYRALIVAMIAGRVVWGLVMCLLIGIGADGFGLGAFFSTAVITAIPGILLQLILIPFIMFLLSKKKA